MLYDNPRREVPAARDSNRLAALGARPGVNRITATDSVLDSPSWILQSCPQEVKLPVWLLYPPAEELSGLWARTVNGNRRLIFRFHGKDGEFVDYLDYH
jgi:hypothetical protein